MNSYNHEQSTAKVTKIKKNYLLTEMKSLAAEQLNTIPDGFNNNIIWNLGHMVCASQLVCYRRAGLPLVIDEKYVTPFLTNTRPETIISDKDIDVIKDLFINTMDSLQADYQKQIFKNYTKSENIERYYGIELLTIDDAIEFLLYHEGYHCAKIINLKQILLWGKSA